MFYEPEELLDNNSILDGVNGSVVLVAVVAVVGVVAPPPGVTNNWRAIDVSVVWLLDVGRLETETTELISFTLLFELSKRW